MPAQVVIDTLLDLIPCLSPGGGILTSRGTNGDEMNNPRIFRITIPVYLKNNRSLLKQGSG
jgi:hypothetical protein